MKHINFFLSILIVIIIAGCSAQEAEVFQNTSDLVEQVYKEAAPEANEEAKGYSYYVPKGYSVEQIDDNNMIFTRKGNTYVLFVNPLEDEASAVLFDAFKNNDKQLFSAAYTDIPERFGFLVINGADDSLYEVSVGIGGIKMSTKAKLRHIEKSAEEMMEIVRSVSLKR